MQKKNKIGRNQKCPCNSGKKFKKCCINKIITEKENENRKYLDGHDTLSNNLIELKNYLQTKYTDHKIIDISNILNPKSYKFIQIKNFKKKTIMIAERNLNNNDVFLSRGPAEVNTMVMYHGAYQCFDFDKFKLAVVKVQQMIDQRK